MEIFAKRRIHSISSCSGWNYNLDSRALLRMTVRERKSRRKQRKHWGRERVELLSVSCARVVYSIVCLVLGALHSKDALSTAKMAASLVINVATHTSLHSENNSCHVKKVTLFLVLDYWVSIIYKK